MLFNGRLSKREAEINEALDEHLQAMYLSGGAANALRRALRKGDVDLISDARDHMAKREALRQAAQDRLDALVAPLRALLAD